MDGNVESFDIKSEKRELDLFLSTIVGGKVTPAVTSSAPDDSGHGEIQYENTMNIKITDYDEANTVKWDRTPAVTENTSRGQYYDAGSSDQTARLEPEEVTSHKITWIALLIVFLVLSITAAGLLWFYPERRNQALRLMVANIPYIDRVFTTGKVQKNPDAGKIKFMDIRHRIIRNAAMGRNIRVVEGIAVNNTAASVSKVKLTGELYGADGSLLMLSKGSIAGNILTDDKLEKLDEEKIFSALSMAPVSSLSEAGNTPLDQIPFMVVFTREPPNVFKLVIIPALE